MDIEELKDHRTISQTRQSVWDVRRTYKVGDNKMRVDIHHDPYEFQAYAVLELLSPDLKWNVVHTLPTSAWYSHLNVLYVEKFTAEHLEAIDEINEILTKIGKDLLS